MANLYRGQPMSNKNTPSPTGRRKYFQPDEARAHGWYSRKELAKLFRLKPAPGQQPAADVWQGMGVYEVFDAALAVAMRPYRKPTLAQLEALQRGRELTGTSACENPSCTNRYDTALEGPYCRECDEDVRRAECRAHMQQWIQHDWAILDVETTGLEHDAQIVELCILDSAGTPLLNSLIKPSISVPAEATAIHGISDADLINAPTWPAIHAEVCRILTNRPVLAYNADFDKMRLLHMAEHFGLPAPQLQTICIMKLVARWIGEQTAYGSYRWYSLQDAAQTLGIAPTGAHRALDDCLTTLGLIRQLQKV